MAVAVVLISPVMPARVSRDCFELCSPGSCDQRLSLSYVYVVSVSPVHSAVVGSVFVARCGGSQQARSAIPNNATAT